MPREGPSGRQKGGRGDYVCELLHVTHRTLSKTLKKMEADGLVIRRDYGEIPPRVDYSLTPRGRSLEPILRAMERWAQDHREEAEIVSGR